MVRNGPSPVNSHEVARASACPSRRAGDLADLGAFHEWKMYAATIKCPEQALRRHPTDRRSPSGAFQ